MLDEFVYDRVISDCNVIPLLQLLMLKPSRYGLEHKENFSGEGDEKIYHSKGHALNPGQRNWTRYQPWQPGKS